jgi:hypothetical protein
MITNQPAKHELLKANGDTEIIQHNIEIQNAEYMIDHLEDLYFDIRPDTIVEFNGRILRFEDPEDYREWNKVIKDKRSKAMVKAAVNCDNPIQFAPLYQRWFHQLETLDGLLAEFDRITPLGMDRDKWEKAVPVPAYPHPNKLVRDYQVFTNISSPTRYVHTFYPDTVLDDAKKGPNSKGPGRPRNT